MDVTDDELAKQVLGALLKPLARLTIESGVPLYDVVEHLKLALVDAAYAQTPDASASHISLVTGVHRKDIRRLEQQQTAPSKSVSAARVLSIWMNDPIYLENGVPRDLPRGGVGGFDDLVRQAKVDSAVTTLLSVLDDAGCVRVSDDIVTFLSGALVPHDIDEKLRAAVATLAPHMQTVVGNVVGDAPQYDKALRYSHLSDQAAKKLEVEAARLANEMLHRLDTMAFDLQQNEAGSRLFVAGIYTHNEDKGS